MKITVYANNGSNFDVDVKPCPFCGGEPEIANIGNDHTKSQKIKIKCPQCRVERINAAIMHGVEWLIDISVNQWNSRVTESDGQILTDDEESGGL